MQSTTVGIDDITALGALADELGLVLFDAPVSGTRAPAEAGPLASDLPMVIASPWGAVFQTRESPRGRSYQLRKGR